MVQIASGTFANLVSYWENGKIHIITPEEGFWEAVEKSAFPDEDD